MGFDGIHNGLDDLAVPVANAWPCAVTCKIEPKQGLANPSNTLTGRHGMSAWRMCSELRSYFGLQHPPANPRCQGGRPAWVCAAWRVCCDAHDCFEPKHPPANPRNWPAWVCMGACSVNRMVCLSGSATCKREMPATSRHGCVLHGAFAVMCSIWTSAWVCMTHALWGA
jgi:hypothetical protein